MVTIWIHCNVWCSLIALKIFFPFKIIIFTPEIYGIIVCTLTITIYGFVECVTFLNNKILCHVKYMFADTFGLNSVIDTLSRMLLTSLCITVRCPVINMLARISQSEQWITTATKMSRRNPIYQFRIIEKLFYSMLANYVQVLSVKANSMQAYFTWHLH